MNYKRCVPRRMLWKGIGLLLLPVAVLYLSTRVLADVFHRHVSSSKVHSDIVDEFDISKHVGRHKSSHKEMHRARLKPTTFGVNSDAQHGFETLGYVDSVRQSSQLDGTIETYHVPRESKVQFYNYSFSINGQSICADGAPFMLIVVPSVHTNVKQRKKIRETWGSVAKTGVWVDGTVLPRIKLAFFIAHGFYVKNHDRLYEESSTYGDIVFADFIDTYRNLTVKMISALNWVDRYCSGVQYILKNDHDTFVHLPRLIRIIEKLNSSNTFIGRQGRNLTVARGESKWSMSVKEYPLETYPPYTIGMFYVIPGHLAGKMFAISEYLPPLSVEDVFVTGILRKILGAKLKDLGNAACISPITCKLLREQTVSLSGLDGYIPLQNIWDLYKRWAEKHKKLRH